MEIGNWVSALIGTTPICHGGVSRKTAVHPHGVGLGVGAATPHEDRPVDLEVILPGDPLVEAAMTLVIPMRTGRMSTPTDPLWGPPLVLSVEVRITLRGILPVRMPNDIAIYA